MHLRWRLAVVTGGGSGLGREICLRLGRAGVGVLVADRDATTAESVAAEVRESRVKAWPWQVDVTDAGELDLLAARMRDLGGADLLVNNAGGWTDGDQYPAAPPEAWAATLDLNLLAPMRLTQLFLADVGQRRGRSEEPGAVVNVASEAGLERAGYGSPEYAAAKAGLIRLTTALARPDVARLARVTCVVPGWIGLDRARAELAVMDPAERDAQAPLVPPGQVAQTVVDLLERGAAGTVVELLGGRPPVVRLAPSP
ncbi:SDR family NAD(P)-dependent oxidoreductase [Nocardioides guangzhouensis]|nr:SDR family NAD(P)-dependent oxidoreductase [Nocardioides guangzhouensis]